MAIFRGTGTPGSSEQVYSQADLDAAIAAALASEVAAAASQVAAETAETNAETAETNAETAETNAETAQTAAELAETNAETAQTAAELAETNAETAETNAAASEAAAAASYDSFDDRYLGVKSSAPTLDNDSNALVVGALYYLDTGSVGMKVYSGSVWNDLPGMLNVVEDVTPQLGADLDANGFDIQFDDATGITDSNGNELITFQETASAVNELEVTNAATGTMPSIGATGGDTDIDVEVTPKGTGALTVNGNPVHAPAEGEFGRVIGVYEGTLYGVLDSDTLVVIPLDLSTSDSYHCIHIQVNVSHWGISGAPTGTYDSASNVDNGIWEIVWRGSTAAWNSISSYVGGAFYGPSYSVISRALVQSSGTYNETLTISFGHTNNANAVDADTLTGYRCTVVMLEGKLHA